MIRDSAGRHVVPRAVVMVEAHSSLINLELLHITLEGVVMQLRSCHGPAATLVDSCPFESRVVSSLGRHNLTDV